MSEKNQWISMQSDWPVGEGSRRTAHYASETLGDQLVVMVEIKYRLGGFMLASTKKEDEYEIEVRGARGMSQPKAPNVPEDFFRVALPKGATILEKDIRINSVAVEVEKRITVAPTPFPFLEGGDRISEKDAGIYESDTAFPQSLFFCGVRQRIDGMNQVNIVVFPITYRPLSKIVVVRREINISIPCRVSRGNYYKNDDVDFSSAVVRTMVGWNNPFLRKPF